MKNITKPDIWSSDMDSVRHDGYNNVNLAELLALTINMWLCIFATEPRRITMQENKAVSPPQIIHYGSPT